jgi:hypothetical protein
MRPLFTYAIDYITYAHAKEIRSAMVDIEVEESALAAPVAGVEPEDVPLPLPLPPEAWLLLLLLLLLFDDPLLDVWLELWSQCVSIPKTSG